MSPPPLGKVLGQGMEPGLHSRLRGRPNKSLIFRCVDFVEFLPGTGIPLKSIVKEMNPNPSQYVEL